MRNVQPEAIICALPVAGGPKTGEARVKPAPALALYVHFDTVGGVYMDWKVWGLVLGLSLLVLAVIGLIVHADMRLVGADLLGALVAMSVVLLLNRGRTAAVAATVLSAITLFVMALLAVTSRNSPVLVALTLAFAFAFAFLSWTRLSSPRDAGVAGRPPRTA
jgi:hypothetical protein